VFRWVVRSPFEHFFSNGRKIRAELAAEIAYECPESRQQLVFLKETPQLIVSGLEEVLADVAQKVEVTAEDGDLQLQLPNEVLSRPAHGPAEVAHERTGKTEALRHIDQVWRDLVGPFRGQFPRAQHPLSPAVVGDQKRAAAVFAGGIEFERVNLRHAR
jgi:hypothetical protein